MHTLNLEKYGLGTMTKEECLETVGGHDGIAYQIGHGLGKAIVFTVTVVGFVALFLFPKS